MTEEKRKEKKSKSWIDRLAERVGYTRKVKGSIAEETKLADGIITSLMDKKLDQRIELVDMLLSALNKRVEDNVTPKEKVKALKFKLDILDEVIQKTASPYAAAGNNPRYAKLVSGWNRMFGLGSSWVQRTEWYFTEDDNPNRKAVQDFVSNRVLSDNNVIIHNLELALTQHIFPPAKDVLGYCYKDEDVRPSLVTIIQATMAPTGAPGLNINKAADEM
jgi:hypothetical protein